MKLLPVGGALDTEELSDAAWLAATALPGGTSTPSPADLPGTVALLEAIHQIGSQLVADGGASAEDDL